MWYIAKDDLEPGLASAVLGIKHGAFMHAWQELYQLSYIPKPCNRISSLLPLHLLWGKLMYDLFFLQRPQRKRNHFSPSSLLRFVHLSSLSFIFSVCHKGESL